MPPKAQSLGPGVFTLGAVGTSIDVTAQITNCRVVPSVSREDPTPTLSGEDLPGDRTVTWTLSGTVLQDLSDDGIVEWSWERSGQVVPFTFTPITSLGKDVTGTVEIDPLELGGDVKKKNTSDFEWTIIGTPALSAGLG